MLPSLSNFMWQTRPTWRKTISEEKRDGMFLVPYWPPKMLSHLCRLAEVRDTPFLATLASLIVYLWY